MMYDLICKLRPFFGQGPEYVCQFDRTGDAGYQTFWLEGWQYHYLTLNFQIGS